MKKGNLTYQDTITHTVICGSSLISLAIAALMSYAGTIWFVIDTIDAITPWTICLAIAVVFVVGGMMLSASIIVILLITFFIDEYFEHKWESKHEETYNEMINNSTPTDVD